MIRFANIINRSLLLGRQVVAAPLTRFYFTNFFVDEVHLNPYLTANLKANNIVNPTSIQRKAIDVLLQGKNAIIGSESSSGKTLCYLLPILHQILSKKLDVGDDLYSQVSPRGAIILVPTKELGSQVYQAIRKLDIKNKINVSRVGSLAYIAPIIHILSDEEQAKNPSVQKRLGQLAYESVVKGISWLDLDILIVTPSQLQQMIQKMESTNGSHNIDPKIVVVDEFDLLLGDVDISKSTKAILTSFGSVFSHPQNKHRQFIFAGASFSKPQNAEDPRRFLQRLFESNMQFIKSEHYERLPPTVSHEIIKVNDYLNAHPECSIQDMLVNIVKEQNACKKIIVFANNTENVIGITKLLSSNTDLSVGAFHAKLSTELRMELLHQFYTGEVNMLVCTDLGSRGIDFEDVDLVIEFDFAESATAFLHRAGRTGRNGKPGRILSFIRRANEQLVSQVQGGDLRDSI